MSPKRYQNLNGDSGVTQYMSGSDYIEVRFDGPFVYTYDSVRPGAPHVARMKILAAAGRGLGSYINTHIRKEYARKRIGW